MILVLVACCCVHILAIEIEKVCGVTKFDEFYRQPISYTPRIDDEKTFSLGSLADMKYWYDIGYAECMAYLNEHSFEFLNSQTQVSITNKHAQSQSVRPQCRGIELLYKLTGLLTWTFGPKETCETNSVCWVGILTCGKLNQPSINEHLLKWGGNRFKDIKLNKWSMKSLQIHVRVVGHEIVAPATHLISLGSVDVLISTFALTIPGEYSIETRLQRFYPGMLVTWPANDIKRHQDVKLSVYLGGTEFRCRFTGCSDKDIPNYSMTCDLKSRIINTPITIDVKRGDHNCGGVSMPPSVLPICTHGNHSGRWIQLPDSFINQCNAYNYIHEYDKSTSKKKRYEIIGSYMNSVESISTASLYKHIDAKIQSLISTSTSISNNNNTNTNNLSEEDVFYIILSQYGHDNICSLLDLSSRSNITDNRLAFFAPYTCRYTIYTPSKGAKCLQQNHMRYLLFDGGSVVRDMYTGLANILNLSTKRGQAGYSSNGNITTDYRFTFHDDFGMNLMKYNGLNDKTNAYITDLALGHLVQMDAYEFGNSLNTASWKYIWNHSNIMKYSQLKKRIFINLRYVMGLLPYMRSAEMVSRSEHLLIKQLFYNNNVNLENTSFDLLNIYLLSAGKADVIDGVNLMDGSLHNMAHMVLLNMLCNNGNI